MNTLVANLLAVEKALSAKKGAFSLFALFLREGATDKWDLVISAPWVEADKESALNLISAKVSAALTPSELLAISRIVFVEPSSPAVVAINRAIRVEHSTVDVRDSSFFGLAIKHAHIFASARQDSDKPAKASPKKALQRTRRKPVRR
jgi:hypothetical protein